MKRINFDDTLAAYFTRHCKTGVFHEHKKITPNKYLNFFHTCFPLSIPFSTEITTIIM